MTGVNYVRKDIVYVPLATNSSAIQLESDKNCRWSNILNLFWIIGALLVTLVYLIGFLEMKPFMIINRNIEFPELSSRYNSLNGYLINTPGCRIPEMDPFDNAVKAFISEPETINCSQGVPPLFESNLTSLFMIPRYLPQYNLSSTTDINCCYKEFWRQEPSGTDKDIHVKFDGNCIPINGTTAHVEKEFVKLICKNKEDKSVYEDYFAFVPLKKKIQPPSSKDKKPNLLVLGLDAVSRVNLHRQLPNTYRYLTKELGAVELLGYNKVADNTFPNLIPVLTGKFESELQESCWPNTNSHFDNCTFLWTNFTKNNYVTVIGEDCAKLGIFNYQRKGFVKQPTDYYYTSFIGEAEAAMGHVKSWNCYHCVGRKEAYKLTLAYIRKFVTMMNLESTPYFGFFWGTSLSHDFLNRPALGDQSYYDLLSYLKKNGHLENTIFIFMSDHGIRWGSIRQTYQGQMEERLPFVFMTLPKWFKENYHTAVKNLNINTRKLTTPFDLHETLKDLLDLNNLKQAGNIFNKTVSRGYSLFNEIPAARTCEDAAISSHWCTCQQSVEIASNDTQVIAAAKFAVSNINSQLEGYAQCAVLMLDSVLNARVLYHDSEHITKEKSVTDYTITLKTTPGEAVFEVTVRNKEGNPQILKTTTRSPNELMGDLWENFTITGTVSRLNLYGQQSYCITDFHLKLYCYCTSLLRV